MTLELKKIVEALLFSAERPVSTKEMREIFAEATDEENPGVAEAFRNTREAQIAATLEELKVEYDTQERSFQLVEIAGGWRLVSRPEYAPWLKKLLDEARPHRLSQPSLETLSIIALRQPLSRADIAAIRGVEVDGVIKTLLERDLITITGKSDVPGRPLLYGTTVKFLEHFGLNSLDDMPKAAELRLQAAALKTAEAKTVTQPEGAAAPAEPATDAAKPAEPSAAVFGKIASAAPAALAEAVEPTLAKAEAEVEETTEDLEAEDGVDDEDEDEDDEDDDEDEDDGEEDDDEDEK